MAGKTVDVKLAKRCRIHGEYKNKDSVVSVSESHARRLIRSSFAVSGSRTGSGEEVKIPESQKKG